MPMRDGSALNATSLRPTGLPYTFKPDQFSSHAAIANTIRERATQARDEPYCVLDIGCAYGFLRPYLPAPRFYLIGVERDEKAADQARASYDEIYLADIVTARRLPLRCPVNTIVFGDILEHVADPLMVLQSVHRDYAGNTTQVVISLPNVAHLYMRINLLLGRFEYADRGITDRTHLRFFTLSTARRLIADSGLQLRSVGATPVPLPLIHSAFGEGRLLFPLHRINSLLAKTFKTFLAYQFILEADRGGG